MAYVIGPDCTDILDRSCIDVCPVDCIYVGERKSYINGNECIDCGACEVECPVEAIVVDRVAKKNPKFSPYLTDQESFFHDILPGRDAPLGDPNGATALGPVGVDTPLVAALPSNQ
ncbi:ferredoxin [Flexivirga endophytica]|uniref:Ferredoxin n=1 Tax=Flexivirga endophytica TaxID=1849103 RepID=A0A916SVJ7_9MICO|nr:ferredoxin family protein [Flexivirga endophytica]GGB18530.1 ferredoxin [Flexivirga endophytica]GHB37151.1 ferredoxin [Flexivirga endophytica]